jgi:hypothetical protein
MTPAVRTYLTNYRLANKKVAFFTTQGSDDAHKTVTEMESMVTASKVIGTLSVQQKDIKTSRYGIRLLAFVEQLAS